MGTRFFTPEVGFFIQSFLTKSILFRAIFRKEGIKMDPSIKNEKLNLEQIQKLSENTIFGISATLINSLILSLILWNVAPKMSVIIWFFLLTSVSLVRFFLQRSYSKAMPEFEEAKKWKKWFLLTIALSGVIWGSAGIFLFPPDSIGHQTFIAFVLGGMVAGSVGLFSVILTAFLAYSIPALLPIVIMFFSVKDEIHIAMGIMGILFWLIMFLTAKGLNKTIATSLNLKHENVDLISELQGEIKERKEIEKELLRKHEEIEGIVEKRTSELRDVNKKLVEEIEVRKNAEKVLRQSEERLSLAGETANLGMWAWRIDLGRIFVNETFYEITGLTEEEARNFSLKIWLSKFHPDDRKQTIKILQSLFKGETKRMENEFRFQHPEKGWIWLYGIGRVIERDKDGNPIHLVGVHQDITERKRIEEDREKLISELQKALKEIKTLRGILPLCSFCKKIRDDKGYWEQVDVYIHKYSEADISHSICPDCMKKHYPKEYEDMYPTEE
jgi:PAS domain S-box-containing protein